MASIFLRLRNRLKALSQNLEGEDTGLGVYPLLVHVDAFPERRYLFTTRFLALVATGSAAVTIALACFIFLKIPLQRINVALVGWSPWDQRFVMFEDKKRISSVEDLFIEQQVISYVIKRYTISKNLVDNERRWGAQTDKGIGGDIEKSSALEVYQSFLSQQANRWFRELALKGFTRDVEILRSARVSGSAVAVNGVLWITEFKTTLYGPGGIKPKVQYWRAYTRALLKGRDNLGEMTTPFGAPLGFTVTNHSLGVLPMPAAYETLDIRENIPRG